MIFHRLGDFWSNRPPVWRWRAVLGGLALALVAALLLSDKPWDVARDAAKLKLPHIVAIWGWWAALADVAILGGLMFLCPWWAGTLHDERSTLNAQLSTPRWFWPLVIAAMVLAGCFAFPRLGHGFWDDEEFTVRSAVVGKFVRDKKTGEIRFDRLRWDETFFDYRTPNNHILHSALARVSAEASGAANRPEGLPFDERAIRMPAFIFGMLAVAAVAWLLLDFSLPLAGVVAAFLLAMHPWVIRYASEARGYSMVLCLVPVLLVFWRRAVLTGVWKWWTAFAACQFALVYTYPGMALFLVTLNVTTLPTLFFSKDVAGPFAAQSGRWFCVNALAALPAVILMAPLLPQAKEYFDFSRGAILEFGWLKNAGCYLLAGVPWGGSEEFYPALQSLWRHHPLPGSLLVICTVFFMLAGFCRLASGGWTATVPAMVLVVAPLVTFFAARAKMLLIYESYLIHALVGVVAFSAVGIVSVSEKIFARLPRARPAVFAACAVVVAGYFAATMGFRSWLADYPLQQIRESVELTRPTLDPGSDAHDEALTASFCIPPYLYDAHMVRLDSANDLIAMLRRADREGKTLFLNIGMPWAARDYSPKMWAMFNDPALFTDRVHLRGFDPGLDRIVARYVPGSAESYDFARYEGEDR